MKFMNAKYQIHIPYSTMQTSAREGEHFTIVADTTAMKVHSEERMLASVRNQQSMTSRSANKSHKDQDEI